MQLKQSACVVIAEGLPSLGVLRQAVYIPNDAAHRNDEEEHIQSPEEEGFRGGERQLPLGYVHLKWKMHRHRPKAEATYDAHDVIEERKQRRQDCCRADVCGAPDEGKEAEPEHAASEQRNIDANAKEASIREAAMQAALDKCKERLADHLQWACMSLIINGAGRRRKGMSAIFEQIPTL